MTTITLSWLDLIALLGAVQGVCLAFVLGLRRRNRTANRLLAVLMLALSIQLVTSVYLSVGFVETLPHFFGVGYPQPLLYGPLVYLYAVSASDRTRPLRPRDALHFVPFVAAIAAGLPIYLLDGPAKVAFAQGLENGEVPLLVRVVDPLKVISGAIYATAAFLFLRRHRVRVRDSYSSLEHVNLRWLLWLAAFAAGIWAVAIVSQLAQYVGQGSPEPGDNFVTLAIAILVYGIGYMALRQPEIFRYDTADWAVSKFGMEPVPETSATEAPNTETPRYERSGLTESAAADLKSALLALMERDRPWKDSNLTLADLARLLSTTTHRLSEVLNSHLNQTFYDFVNGYRVRDVQRRMVGEKARNLTLLSVALDAGFASKSTFNEVFKKHTGRTPSEFRKSTDI